MQYNKRKIILFGSLSIIFGTLSIAFYFFSNRVAVVEEEISFTVTKDTVKNSNEKTLTKSDLLKKSNEIKEDSLVTEKLNDSLSDFEAIPTDEFTRIDEVKRKILINYRDFQGKR